VTKAEIVIGNDVILDGEGNLTVDGNDTHRIFSVPSDITAELRGVAVMRGRAQDGGGIFNAGVLALTDSAVSSNTTNAASIWGGGGIFNAEVLTLTNCTVSDNSASPSGGGIYNAGTLTVTNSTVSGNRARDSGGIENDGMLIVTNSTVSDNSASWYSGGGISNRPDGTVTLTNSTVSGNTAAGYGGGILNSVRGVVTVMNSTVSGNEASSGGGGIYNNVDTLTLTNSWVDGECYCDAGCDGIVTSNGYNIESPGDTCGFEQTGDQINVSTENLSLGPLADNGGPTRTHVLLPGSVAIDHIPAVDCEVDEDQRGEPRPETGGDGCDVGAFEVQSGD
jgi:hypothetical protein